MSGLSVKLPVQLDPEDGYALTKTYLELVRQNLKMLLLTIPGERIMLPNFGVGLKQYLFEQDTGPLKAEIIGRIKSQVARYLDYINILKVDIDTGNPELDTDASHVYYISITYYIGPLNVTEILNLEIS